jgi:hypothetical protein
MPRRPAPHPWEVDVDHLAEWLEEESTILADAMRYGGRSPFSARVSEGEKYRYYHKQFFLPDGSPNEQGRSQVMKRLGPQGYATVWQALMDGPPGRGRSEESEDAEPDREPMAIGY